MINLKNAGRFVLVASVEGIIGWIAISTVESGVGDARLRDYFLILIWPLLVIAGTVVLVVWMRQPSTNEPILVGSELSTNTDQLEAACLLGSLLWDIYGSHPVGQGQEEADLLIRDRLRRWEHLASKALGAGSDRDLFDAPVNTSGMDNRVQVAKEQLRVKRDVLKGIAQRRGVSC